VKGDQRRFDCSGVEPPGGEDLEILVEGTAVTRAAVHLKGGTVSLVAAGQFKPVVREGDSDQIGVGPGEMFVRGAGRLAKAHCLGFLVQVQCIGCIAFQVESRHYRQWQELYEWLRPLFF
jgi:hypothetical protein